MQNQLRARGSTARHTHEEEHADLGENIALAVAQAEKGKANQDEEDEGLADCSNQDRLVPELPMPALARSQTSRIVAHNLESCP